MAQEITVSDMILTLSIEKVVYFNPVHGKYIWIILATSATQFMKLGIS